MLSVLSVNVITVNHNWPVNCNLPCNTNTSNSVVNTGAIIMEANPLPRVQTVANHTIRSPQQVSEQSSQGDNNFKQQLSNQLDQAVVASNSENIQDNQILEEFIQGDEMILAEQGEVASEVLIDNNDHLLTVDTIELEARVKDPQVLIHTSDSTDEVTEIASLADPVVPLEGNNLPPIDSQLPLIEPVAASQNPAGTPVVSTPAVNSPVVQAVVEPVKASQTAIPANSQMPDVDLADGDASFREMALSKAVSEVSGKQENNPQNTQSRTGISISSSVAAAASQLQQVAQTTASSNLNLPLSGLPVDSLLSVGINPAAPAISSVVQNPAWSQGLTNQVAWMVQGNIQSAEIKLNPAHLGPLEVKLSIEDDVARLSFISSHAPVREALDAAIPRLREMLEQLGISLGDVDVSQHSDQDQQSADEATDGTGTLANRTELNTEESGLDDGAQIGRISINDGLSIYA